MGLITLSCPNCGGQLQVEEGREEWYCNFCGAKVIKDKQYVEISGEVSVKGIATAESLLERAFMEIEDERFDEASELLERALDAEPKNWKAYLGRLLCENELNSIEDLRYSYLPLTAYDDFNKAFQFASEKERIKLKNYNDIATAAYKAEQEKVLQKISEMDEEIKEKGNKLSKLEGRNSEYLKWSARLYSLKWLFLAVAIIAFIIAMSVKSAGLLPYFIAGLSFACFIVSIIIRNRFDYYTALYNIETGRLNDLIDDLNQYKVENGMYL